MKNKIFLIKRMEEVGYDEYGSCVLVAETEQDAIDMIERKKKPFTRYWDCGNRTITEVGETEKDPCELCSSFNAG